MLSQPALAVLPVQPNVQPATVQLVQPIPVQAVPLQAVVVQPDHVQPANLQAPTADPNQADGDPDLANDDVDDGGNDTFVIRRGRGRPRGSLNRSAQERLSDCTRHYEGDLPRKSPRKLSRETGFYCERND